MSEELLGKLIYYKNKNFGVICDIENGIYKAGVYLSGKTQLIEVDKDEMVLIDELLISSVLDIACDGYFVYGSKSRGRDLYNDRRISSLSYNPQKITVEGTVTDSYFDKYSVSIRLNKRKKDKLDFNCSCSTSYYCKHSYGLLLYFRELVKKFKNYYTWYNQIKNTEMSTVAGTLLDILFSNYVSVFDIKDILDTLDRTNDIAFSKAVTEIITCISQLKNLPELTKVLIKYLFYDGDVRKNFNHIRKLLGDNNDAILRYILEINNCMVESLYYEKTHDLTEYGRISQIVDFYLGNYGSSFVKCIKYRHFIDNANNYYSQKSFYRDYPDILSSFSMANKNLELSSKEKEDIIDTMCNYEVSLPDSEITFFNEEDKRKLYLHPKYKGSIPVEFIFLQDSKEALRLVANQQISRELVEGLIENAERFTKDSPVFYAKILACCKLSDCLPINLEQKIMGCLSKIENADYLISFVINHSSRYEKTYKKENQIITEVDESKLRKFFEVNYSVYGYENSANYDIHYKIKFNNKYEVLSCHKKSGNKLIKEKNYIDGSKQSALYDYVVNYVDNKHKDEINRVVLEHAKNVREKQNREKYEKIKSLALEISDKNKRTAVKKQAKYVIEPHFESRNYDYTGLWIKVGDSKKYVIQDLRSFLRSFENSDVKPLGKQFVLTHNPSFFSDEYKDFLNFLLNMKDNIRYDRRYADLPDKLAAMFLPTLTNTIVYLNEKEYFLEKEKISVNYLIDENNRLIIKNEKNISFDDYYLMGNMILGQDNREKKMYFLDADQDNIDLLKFAINTCDLDLAPVSKVINQDILPYYSDKIEIAEKVKKNYPISDIKIKVFFDYNEKVVSYYDKFYIEDKEVNRTKITNNADLIHIDKYESVLSELGFVNNKIEDDTLILNFFRTDFSALKKYCNVMLSDSIQRKVVSNFERQKIEIKNNSNIMSALMVQSQYSEEELEEIYKAIKRKKKYIALAGDRIVALDNQFSDEFYEVVDDLKLNSKHLYEEKRLSLAESLRGFAHRSVCSMDEYLENLISDITSFKSYNIPDISIEGELRPYQNEGVRWLKVLSDYGIGGILADDMGLGKTIEIIALLSIDDTKKPSLIMCPKSLVFNWKNEFLKFNPNTEVVEIYGSAENRQAIISNIKKNKKVIYISSYDSLRNDIDCYKSKTFNYLIADEAQNIKNTETQKSKTAKMIKADHIFALTGTPIENSVTDLWSIFDLIIPGYLSELNEFKNSYSDDKSEVLAKRIAPFILRRTKNLVLKDLPDKYERVISADMSESQRKLYDSFILKAREALESGSKAFDMLPYITRLRQICVDPSMFVDNFNDDSGKLSLLSDLIDEYLSQNHKLLIFSQFVKVFDSVKAMLDKKNIDYYLLTGDTAADKRIEYSDKFNNEDDVKVFLISLKAGGTGLNLTGADTVIHLDPWWNISAENQATDRAHRIGQKRNVEVIKLICENSIEQKVVELQNIKKNTIDKLIAKDDTSITQATVEDIAFILGK